MEEHDCKFEKIPLKIDVAIFDPWVYLAEKWMLRISLFFKGQKMV